MARSVKIDAKSPPELPPLDKLKPPPLEDIKIDEAEAFPPDEHREFLSRVLRNCGSCFRGRGACAKMTVNNLTHEANEADPGGTKGK